MKLSSKSGDIKTQKPKHLPTDRKRSTTSTGDCPVLDDIRIRAYEIYMERGGQPGHDPDDWIQAERELGAKVGSNS